MSQTVTSSEESSRVFVGFHLKTDDAKQLYKCASDLGIPVARLLRYLVVEKTNQFQEVDYTPPQKTAKEPTESIRKSKRRFSQ